MSDHRPKPAKVVPLLRPGTFVTLDNQPADLPPFQLIQCRGGRCWVRQQAWGQYVHWEVEHERLRAAERGLADRAAHARAPSPASAAVVARS